MRRTHGRFRLNKLLLPFHADHVSPPVSVEGFRLVNTTPDDIRHYEHRNSALMPRAPDKEGEGEVGRGGSGRLVAEFGVLMGEDETAQRAVLALVLERRLVSCFLFLGEGFDSRNNLRKLVVNRNLVCFVRFFLQVTRIANAPSTERTPTFLEISVRMRTDFSSELFDEFDRFEFSHKTVRVLVPENLDNPDRFALPGSEGGGQ